MSKRELFCPFCRGNMITITSADSSHKLITKRIIDCPQEKDCIIKFLLSNS